MYLNHFFLLCCLLLFGFLPVMSNLMNGINLKLAAFQSPPFDVMTLLPNGSVHMRGAHIQIYTWLADKLHFTFSLVPVVDQDLINRIGVYESAVVKLENKEVDGLLASLVVDPSRQKKADFTSFMAWSEPYSLITPTPDLESRLFAFTKPFQPLVWLFFALSLIVIIGMMSWFSWIYSKKSFKRLAKNQSKTKTNTYENRLAGNLTNSVGYFTLYAANILTNHGMYTPFTLHSFRILVGSWLLATSVLVYGYCSIVVSALTVPTMKPPINNFEDLTTNLDVGLLVRGDMVVGQQILSATTGVLKTLGDQLRKHSDKQICLDFPSLFKRLSGGGYAFLFINSFNRDFIVKDYIKERTCRFRISPPIQTFAMGYWNLFFQKGSQYKDTMNTGLVYLWETGLTRYWVDHLTPKRADQCFPEKKDPNSSIVTNKIKLQDLTSAFLILGIGIGISVVCFLIEIILSNIKKHSEERMQNSTA